MAQEMTKTDESNSRRNSTGKILSSNSGEKIPHYLRASTGSCHDFCKYGKKNAFEAEERFPIRVGPRRISTKSFDTQNSAEAVVFPERKSMPVIKLKNSPESKILPLDPERKNINKQQLPKRSSDKKNTVKSKLLAERNKPSSFELKSSSCSKPHLSGALKTMKQEVSSSPEKLDVSSKKAWTKLKERNFSKKHITASKPKSLVTKELSSPDTSGSSSGLTNSNLKTGQRTLTSLKPKSLAAKQISSLESSGGSGRRNSDVKISKRAGTSLVALKKILVPSTGSLSPKPSPRRVASLKAQKNRNVKVTPAFKNQSKTGKAKPKQPNNDEILEKTLCVVKIEAESEPLESDQKNCECPPPPLSSSLSPKSLSLPDTVSLSSHEGEDQEFECLLTDTEEGSFSEDNDIDNEEDSETLEYDCKGKPRKSGMVCSEDVDSHHLKFRRGKVVDLQCENNRPRRLKFRRGKVLGENDVKAHAHRRSFKKIESVDVDAMGTAPGAEMVILRHQDVQGKKDEKGLFNNVIEETANKLVGTQKSKVKALVGAFETVISLQERKPSANSVS